MTACDSDRSGDAHRADQRARGDPRAANPPALLEFRDRDTRQQASGQSTEMCAD